MKRIFISLGLIAMMSISSSCAFAYSTIYTDEIGRMHFLGKDLGPNSKSTQTYENYANPAQKELFNTSNQTQNTENYTNTENSVSNFVNTTTDSTTEQSNINNETPTKRFFKFSQNSYSDSDVKRGVNESKTIYTDDLGREHFFPKGSVVSE